MGRRVNDAKLHCDFDFTRNWIVTFFSIISELHYYIWSSFCPLFHVTCTITNLLFIIFPPFRLKTYYHSLVFHLDFSSKFVLHMNKAVLNWVEQIFLQAYHNLRIYLPYGQYCELCFHGIYSKPVNWKKTFSNTLWHLQGKYIFKSQN